MSWGGWVMIEKLTAWRPSMREYHTHPSISSGFLYQVTEEGLSAALGARDVAIHAGPTTDPQLGKGTTLHAWIEGDEEAKILSTSGATGIWRKAFPRASDPGPVKVRRGKAWEAALVGATMAQADVLLKDEELAGLTLAWKSLLNAGTPAKRQILHLLRTWSPRVPEVSHLWEVGEIPGCFCRIREDMITQAPSGAWCCVQIKTTAVPLGRWWNHWRRYVRRSTAFYRAGERDLFGDTPFRQLLIVARTEPPYEWALFDIEKESEDLDAISTDYILPALREITETLARGERFGPEERGLDL